ncbi:MAG: transposase [Clostridiales bacterium]|nr:transposase [Clostridiales bacterium]
MLSKYGEIAKRGFEKIEHHFPDVIVDKFVVMPNHVHGILVLQSGSTNLPTVIGQYKSYVSKKIHGFDADCKVWQASFHDHVIRNQKDYERIWLYIEGNPMRWGDDCFYLCE